MDSPGWLLLDSARREGHEGRGLESIRRAPCGSKPLWSDCRISVVGTAAIRFQPLQRRTACVRSRLSLLTPRVSNEPYGWAYLQPHRQLEGS